MNLPKSMNFFKHALLAFAVVSLVVISGCDDDDPVVDQPFDGTIMELLKSEQFQQAAGAPADEALDSLVKYLEFYGLDEVVNNTPNITLFAPSNQAFVNLLTTTPGFPSDITIISSSIVQGVLAYHVVPEIVMSEDLTSGAEFETLFDQPNNCNPAAGGTTQVITVNSNGTLFTGSTNEEIEVVLADEEADNGVVHVVESVMIPPSVGATLTPILTTVAATAFLSSDFSLIAGLITYADCGTQGETPLASILANPAGNYTVFLPPNQVLQQYGATVQAILATLATEGIDTPAEVRGLILGHVVTTDELTAAELVAAAPTALTAANMAGIEVSVNQGTVFLNGSIPVVIPDADQRDNGIVHAIGGVLGL